MNLQLFLCEKLVASKPIDKKSMNNPLYLSILKSELEEKYRDVIETSATKPTFYIEAKSSMNERRNYNRPLL